MSKRDETLIILMEECSEVIKECSKIIRFGGDTEDLAKELGDLMCMIDIATKNLDITSEEIEDAYHDKHIKLLTWSNII
ncbi:MAG TPA: hypothetical protein DCM40_09645 [Maribacter sp.]|nr:hypothetical protein [Maribacter sp.]